jgi:hypothetical protein
MADTILAKKAGPDTKVAITLSNSIRFPHRVEAQGLRLPFYRSARSPDWLK